MTTWTPATKQSETWTSLGNEVRVFDPAVFENVPIFDTGQAGGYWVPRAKQSEPWTNA